MLTSRARVVATASGGEAASGAEPQTPPCPRATPAARPCWLWRVAHAPARSRAHSSATPLRYSWSRASLADVRREGSYCSMRFSKSMPSSSRLGAIDWSATGSNLGQSDLYSGRCATPDRDPRSPGREGDLMPSRQRCSQHSTCLPGSSICANPSAHQAHGTIASPPRACTIAPGSQRPCEVRRETDALEDRSYGTDGIAALPRLNQTIGGHRAT
eukprot:scaffold1458_cov146-Isochrysis_galbana.AAC.2